MMTYFHSERNANRLGASFKFLVSDKSKLYLLHKNRSYFLLLMKCNLCNSSNQELSSKEGVWCGTRGKLDCFFHWEQLSPWLRLAIDGIVYDLTLLSCGCKIGWRDKLRTNWRHKLKSRTSFPLRSFQKQHAGGERWKWGITHDSWIEWMTQKWHKWCI